MTCESCGDKPKKCDKDFTKAVIEIDNPEQITLMRRVVIPASMGDDTTVPPTVGKYKNVLLFYEANTKSYLYSSDGIPTQLVNGVTDYEAAVNLPKINGVTLLGNQSSADLKLANAPVIISLDSGQWSSDKTIGQIFDAFNAGTAVMLDFGNAGTEGAKAWPVTQLGYNTEDNMLLGVVPVAQTENASDFTGEGGYGVFKLHDDHSAEIDNIDWQRKMSVTDDTGLSWDGETLSGVPATDTTIGMVKPGDGLSVDADGKLDVNVGDGLSIDSDNELNINTGEGLGVDADNNIYAIKYVFDTVADMKASTDLADGDYAKTSGYFNLNDGGDGLYHVRNKNSGEAEDGMFTYSYSDDLMLELIDNGTITTNQCGIFGDNSIDQSAKLQQFFSYDTENYIIKNGNYLVTDNLSLSSNSYISFEPGANIEFTGPSEDYFVFYMLNKSNIIIDNGSLSGNRLDHAPGTQSSGFLYTIMYSQNIVLNNCKAKDAWCDGFYVGNSFTETPAQETKNIKLLNCASITPGRNGFSICSGENIRIINCETQEAGSAPGAGLDIEPEGNTTDYNSYIKLKDVDIDGFASYKCPYGLMTYNNDHPYSNVVVRNHTSNEDISGESVNLNEQGYIKLVGSIINKARDHGVIIYNSKGSTGLYIKDIVIDGCSASTPTNSNGIDLYGSTNDVDTLKNITIDGVQYMNSFGASDMPTLINQQHFKINNVVLKNINLKAGDPTVVFYHAGDVKLINCIIEKGTDATISRYNIGNFIIDDRELTANKNKNFYYPMPNGEYQFNLVNTTSGYSNAVIFANDYTVTKDGVAQSNSYIGSSVDAVIKFTIIGNKAIIENG